MVSQYGHSMLLNASRYALEFGGKDGNYLSRLVIAISFVGGCLAGIAFCTPLLWSRRTILSMILALPFILYLGFLTINVQADIFKSTGSPQSMLLQSQFAFFSLAAFCLATILLRSLITDYRNPESWLLAMWILGTFLFCSTLNWTSNARSILPMVPAAAILLVRSLEQFNPGWKQFAPWLRQLPVVASGVLAILVAWTDAHWADTARAAAHYFHTLPRFADNREGTYFTGHWGFQYYMESYGFAPLDIKQTQLKLGDTIILPDNNSSVFTYIVSPQSWTEALRWRALPFMATMRPEVGAGFYSSSWGPLPFSLGLVPDETYRVLTVAQPDLDHIRITQLQVAVANEPQVVNLRLQLASMLLNAQRVEEAIQHLETANQLRPDDVGILNNLAWLLATTTSQTTRQAETALHYAQRTCQLTNYQMPECLDTLAIAQAAAGRFEEAIETARQAIDLAKATEQADLVEQILRRLNLYQQRQVYRE